MEITSALQEIINQPFSGAFSNFIISRCWHLKSCSQLSNPSRHIWCAQRITRIHNKFMWLRLWDWALWSQVSNQHQSTNTCWKPLNSLYDSQNNSVLDNSYKYKCNNKNSKDEENGVHKGRSNSSKKCQRSPFHHKGHLGLGSLTLKPHANWIPPACVSINFAFRVENFRHSALAISKPFSFSLHGGEWGLEVKEQMTCRYSVHAASLPFPTKHSAEKRYQLTFKQTEIPSYLKKKKILYLFH